VTQIKYPAGVFRTPIGRFDRERARDPYAVCPDCRVRNPLPPARRWWRPRPTRSCMNCGRRYGWEAVAFTGPTLLSLMDMVAGVSDKNADRWPRL